MRWLVAWRGAWASSRCRCCAGQPHTLPAATPTMGGQACLSRTACWTLMVRLCIPQDGCCHRPRRGAATGCTKQVMLDTNRGILVAPRRGALPKASFESLLPRHGACCTPKMQPRCLAGGHDLTSTSSQAMTAVMTQTTSEAPLQAAGRGKQALCLQLPPARSTLSPVEDSKALSK